MEVDESVVDLSVSSRRTPPATENQRVRRVLRPRTEPRSYAESPDALINGILSEKPRINGTAESESDSSDEGEMPPLAPIKELSQQEIWQRERGLRRLREELRAEEMKLVLLKKLRQSQQLKENVAVVPPAIPQQALPPTGLPSGLSITPTTVKIPSTKGQQPPGAHSRHNNNQKGSLPGQVSSLLRGNLFQQPPPARSSLHAPSLSCVPISNRNSSTSLSVPQPPQRNSMNRPPSSFSVTTKDLTPAVTITPAPPLPQNKQERNREDNQTPAQRQAAAKLALRKQLEKTLLQIPPPKPPPPEMHFIPNPSNTEFIYLVGLEHVVDFLTKEPKQTVPVPPHACQQCKADFTPVWKWEKQSKNRQSNATFPQPSSSSGKEVRVICEQCVTSNVKKALKAEHTNRLKTAFVKALQQEQEIEQRLAQNGVFQVSCNSPAPSPAAPEPVPKAATPTPAPTPRHAATPPAPAPPPAQPTPPPARQSHSSAQEKFSQQSAAAMQALHQQILRGLSANNPAHMMPYNPLFFPYQLAMASVANTNKGATPNMADIQRAAELQRQYLLDMIPPQPGQARHNWKT